MLETCGALLTSDIPAVLTQPLARLWRPWSTSAGIRYKFFWLAKVHHKVQYPFHWLSLRCQQHLLFQTIRQPTKELLLRRDTWNIAYHGCSIRVVCSYLPVASIVEVTKKLTHWSSLLPRANDHLYWKVVHCMICGRSFFISPSSFFRKQAYCTRGLLIQQKRTHPRLLPASSPLPKHCLCLSYR